MKELINATIAMIKPEFIVNCLGFLTVLAISVLTVLTIAHMSAHVAKTINKL